MQRPAFDVIRNCDLPSSFRRIEFSLARSPQHPEGRPDNSYILVAPLGSDDRLDPALWRQHRVACRVVRKRPMSEDAQGHLVRRPGGTWAFKYDFWADCPDEVGVHFKSDKFVVGEYISLRECGESHTYRISSVQPL